MRLFGFKSGRNAYSCLASNEQHSNSICISLEWPANAADGNEIYVGLSLTEKMHFPVTRPVFSLFDRVVQVQGNNLVET